MTLKFWLQIDISGRKSKFLNRIYQIADCVISLLSFPGGYAFLLQLFLIYSWFSCKIFFITGL